MAEVYILQKFFGNTYVFSATLTFLYHSQLGRKKDVHVLITSRMTDYSNLTFEGRGGGDKRIKKIFEGRRSIFYVKKVKVYIMVYANKF